jgi:predicted RNase H-like nuclease (RuvC/YqgF family)
MSGLEGTCMTCEPVGHRNRNMESDLQELKAIIERLTAERDEARREVCEWEHHWDKTSSEQYYADKRRWDCFKCYKEDSK